MKLVSTISVASLLAAITIAPAALAQDGQTHASYIQFGLSNSNLQLTAEADDASGFNLSARHYLTDKVFLRGNYDRLSASDTLVAPGGGLVEFDLNYDFGQVGASYVFAQTEQLDFYTIFQAEYLGVDASLNSGRVTDEDEWGFSAGLGTQALFWDVLDVSLEANYVDIEGETWRVNAAASYRITDSFSLGVATQTWDEFDVVSLTAQYRF